MDKMCLLEGNALSFPAVIPVENVYSWSNISGFDLASLKLQPPLSAMADMMPRRGRAKPSQNNTLSII